MTVGPAGGAADPSLRPPRATVVLLPVVLVAFAANSLITRHVVGEDLLDAGLLSGVRFIAGAGALLAFSLARAERPVVGTANVRPALWLGIYAVCISYGYRYIGAAAGTFVFYASVLLTLVAGDLARRTPVAATRLIGSVVSLSGIGVLASASNRTVTVLGVVLLAATGVAWGLYTAAGRTKADPRVATTGNFLLLAAVIVLPTGVGAASGLRSTGPGLAWAVVMGAGTTAFAYVAWYACQRSLSGAAAGSVQLVIPVITALGAVVLLGEPVSLRLLVAAAMVLAGMRLGRAPSSALPSGQS